MLILTRKLNESIMIGDQIEISVIEIRGEQVKIGISAPKNVKVFREEIYRAIQRENIEAVKSRLTDLPSIEGFLPKDRGGQDSSA